MSWGQSETAEEELGFTEHLLRAGSVPRAPRVSFHVVLVATL